MALLGEICLELSNTVTLQGYLCSEGSLPTGSLPYERNERIGDARSLVWEYKISTPGGFSAGKANIFAHANLSLRELTSLKKCIQRKSNTSIKTERLSIISYCSVPTGDPI